MLETPLIVRCDILFTESSFTNSQKNGGRCAKRQKGFAMRDAFYEVYDEFIELYDDYFLAAREIGKKFPKYRGTVYVFENWEEFAIYELSEGELWNLVNLDTPYAKILNLRDAIDFDSLGRDIVENLNLKNVFPFGEKVFVLTDMNA